MGIFGSRKKTYVSSVVYNMAGDELNRPHYLKTTVLGAVINNRSSISDSIIGSYLEGPGVRFRNFAKWARDSNYNDVIGLVTGTIQTGNSIDDEVLVDELPTPAGHTVSLQSASLGGADFTFWADQFIAEDFPERLGTNYTVDFNEATNTITITWEDTSTETFVPTDFDPSASYLYAVYTTIGPDEAGSLVEGDVIELDEEDDFPDTTGWDLIDTIVDDTITTEVYRRITYRGQAPDRNATYTETEWMYQITEDDTRSYQIDTQNTYHAPHSNTKVFIYKRNSGNPVLDAMFAPNDSMGSFFPFIPFRIDNKFISETFMPTVYPLAKKAYRRSTTGRYDKMIEQLEDNEDLDEIDYAYLVFGVSLNVLENASRKYIYRFFQEILNDYSADGTYDSWKAAWEAADASQQAWMNWKEAQSNPSDPLFGSAEPTRIPYPAEPSNSVRIHSGNNPTMNFDMTIKWLSIKEETGVGLLKPDAKRDEVWMAITREEEFEETYWNEVDGTWSRVPGNVVAANEFTINWQVTPTSWRRIRIVGLKHINMIYGGKSVDITAKEALEDPEESGFIIPLHEGIYRSMGMVDMTQMSTACSFMVFNCYQVVKKKWYQTGIFQIIVVIIIVVISVYTGGAGAGAAGGVLGTNAGVGAALGLSGTAAIVAGAVANAIAAMLIVRVINTASTAVFGEKWGAIIGAIAGVLALQVGTAMASGQSLSTSFGNMMRAENILKLTTAAGKGYSEYLAASTAELVKETQQVMEEYKEESRKIREAWVNNLGGNRGIIDPVALTEAFGVTPESIDSFLGRTLMTGSDVAEMSLDMLTNFVDMTLSTALPT